MMFAGPGALTSRRHGGVHAEPRGFRCGGRPGGSCMLRANVSAFLSNADARVRAYWVEREGLVFSFFVKLAGKQKEGGRDFFFVCPTGTRLVETVRVAILRCTVP